LDADTPPLLFRDAVAEISGRLESQEELGQGRMRQDRCVGGNRPDSERQCVSEAWELADLLFKPFLG
jgi:hypothetical protein